MLRISCLPPLVAPAADPSQVLEEVLFGFDVIEVGHLRRKGGDFRPQAKDEQNADAHNKPKKKDESENCLSHAVPPFFPTFHGLGVMDSSELFTACVHTSDGTLCLSLPATRNKKALIFFADARSSSS
jgi:hypothetical protein